MVTLFCSPTQEPGYMKLLPHLSVNIMRSVFKWLVFNTEETLWGLFRFWKVNWNLESSPSSQKCLWPVALCKNSRKNREKIEKNSPKQREISEAVVKMIVKDIRPISIVESEGFHDLVSQLELCYTMASQQYITRRILPSFWAEFVVPCVPSCWGVFLQPHTWHLV